MRKILLVSALLLSNGLSCTSMKDAVECQRKLNESTPLNQKPTTHSFLKKWAKTARAGLRLVQVASIVGAFGAGFSVGSQSDHKDFSVTALEYHKPPLPKDTKACQYYYLDECGDGYHPNPDNMKTCEEYIKKYGTYIQRECEHETIDPQYYWMIPVFTGGTLGIMALFCGSAAECKENGEDLTWHKRLVNGAAGASFCITAVGGTGAIAESMPNDPQLAAAWWVTSSCLTGLLATGADSYYDYEGCLK